MAFRALQEEIKNEQIFEKENTGFDEFEYHLVLNHWVVEKIYMLDELFIQ